MGVASARVGQRRRRPSPALLEVVRRLPAALGQLARAPYFAVTAAHFEGFGPEEVLEATADPDVLAALRKRGELH